MPSAEDLQKLIEADPADPFPRYGLAMLHKGRGRMEEAISAFEDLVRAFPAYVPGRQQLAMTLEAAGRLEEAREAYRQGIRVALETGDRHAAEEMRAGLEALPGGG